MRLTRLYCVYLHCLNLRVLLHSNENEEDWKDKDMAGLGKFRKEKMSFEWEGFATWRVSGGGVDCFYNAVSRKISGK